MSRPEADFRRAYDALIERMPDPPLFESMRARPVEVSRPRVPYGWKAATGGAALVLIAIGGVALLTRDGGQSVVNDGPSQRTESQERAASVGIVEHPPARIEPGYVPAPVPYLSVALLSDYLGLDTPVVPDTAVVSRDGSDVVFVVVSDLFYQDRYLSLGVEARPITVGQRIGRAVVVEHGLTGCDIVIAAPPGNLVSGATVQSYAEEAAEVGLQVDYTQLFPGVPRTELALSGGFLRPGPSPDLVRIIVNQRPGTAIPSGSILIFQPPNGPERRFTLTFGLSEARGLEFQTPIEYLVAGERVGTVEVLSPTGTSLTSGKLDWWCT